MTMVRCFSCQTENSVPGIVGLRDECTKCSADLHVCKNCVHHDPKVYNECKEPQADVVRDKERSNFCDFFNPSSKTGSQGPSKDDLLKAAEALFKKKT